MCHHYESDYASEREPAYRPEEEVDEEDPDFDEEGEDLDEIDPAVPPADD